MEEREAKGLRRRSIIDFRYLCRRLMRCNEGLAQRRVRGMKPADCEACLRAAFDTPQQFRKARAVLSGVFSTARRRIAELRVEDFVAINPNTGTAPLFRCRTDAELAVKLYRRAPILIHEKTGENPWGITFKQGLFNMTSDSRLFLTAKPEGEDVLPLYEGKLIHHYDHRFNTFTGTGDSVRNLSEDEHKNPDCEITPRYWVRRADVLDKLPKELFTSAMNYSLQA